MPATVPGSDRLNETREWQPGDPLHRRGEYRSYLFNFRVDSQGEECGCGDAASWPVPQLTHDLDGPYHADYQRGAL